MRLNRFLAAAGLGSRRSCDTLITEARVDVNGEVVAKPGSRVHPQRDIVRLDGERVQLPKAWVYLALHKPAGYVTTRSDERGRRTVDEFLGRHRGRVVPIGRLDRASEGLLLFTNNGEFAHRLLHPSFEQPRTYLVWVDPAPSVPQLREIEAGVNIGLGETSGPAQVRVLGRKGETARVRIVLREGKYREVRRIFRSLGLRVTALRRVAYAGVQLGPLPPGSLRPLSRLELEELEQRTGLRL